MNRWISPFWLQQLPAHSGHVCLTFDDGPAPDTTPLLLKSLDHLRIPATHFLIGKKCAAHENLVQEIAEAGHLIANHSDVHQSFLWQSARQQRASILFTEEQLGRYSQYQRWFRPPFGQMNLWTKSVLQSMNYRGVLWSLIARDWVPQGETALWNRINIRLNEGAVIVLHDSHPTTATMIKVLPRLADEVRRRGWEFSQNLFSAESALKSL